MKNERILDAIGAINEEAIYDAKAYKKTKTLRLENWGVLVACLCVVIVGITVWYHLGSLGGGGDLGGFLPGNDGTWQEGIDPGVASVAVIPAGADLLDVADATCSSISEDDARKVLDLGNYIPNALPEKCWYGRGGYYETIMKDGSRYHMIRVTYECGEHPVLEDGESASEAAGNTAFLWMVWGHRPDTDRPVYQLEEVSESLIDQQDGGVFYISYDEIYIGVEQLDISTEDLLAIIKSIK